jgi:methylenetetrahydrofolate dehydrogenase (NADP+)/methenyltetrahydrofolate cyclohydrolase
MSATIIDGTALAKEIRMELKGEVEKLRSADVVPGLAVIIVGEDPASQSYVRGKAKTCGELGIYSETHGLTAQIREEELLSLIDRLNADLRIHGILVQMPLPRHLDPQKVINRIRPDKDVDAFHANNVGKILIGDSSGFLPATPHGVQELLLRTGHDPEGKHVVICGRSNIVGKPLAAMLMQKRKGANATVTVCHSQTHALRSITKEADILVAAIGVPRFIKADMVKRGAVVIDVGMNRVSDAGTTKGYRLVGDVDFEAVKEVASAITPVPGGVGPMTVIMLMHNTILACKRLTGRR